LDLLFRTFTDPGDAVAMESPTYSGAAALARFSGVEIVPLPIREDGPDTAALSGRRVKLVYTMPERQNPTGVTANAARRRELVAAAQAAGALLVEDGYEEPESGLTPLTALDPERALWLGTLSKDLVPGFRIGWLAGQAASLDPPARRETADFQTPPAQAAVAEFCARRRPEGAPEPCPEVETRRMTAGKLSGGICPGELVGMQTGSALFWLHLPEGISGRRVAERAALAGVGVAPGADFDPLGQDRPNLRLSVSRVEKRNIDQGIALLAEAVRSVGVSSAALSGPVV
jgi:DNA-binding transcriptional MocR family regulator